MIRPEPTYLTASIKRIFFHFIFVFVLLFIISFPLPFQEYQYTPDIGKYISPHFETLIKWSAEHVFKIKHHYTSQIISDSTGLYIHTFNLFVISLIAALAWSVLDKNRKKPERLLYWFLVIVRYYLALQLFEYGFNKVFKWQFYLPEPNTLYTPLGNITHDTLFWSAMGLSRSYVVFLGGLELLAASLLLFRRTTLLGALISIGIMIDIIMINFSFDISVKLYSCFLLLLGIFIAAPDTTSLFKYLLSGNGVRRNYWKPHYNSRKIYWVYAAGKCLIICFILFDTLSVYAKTNNFNDDNAPRPPFHGAYNVSFYLLNNDTIPLSLDNPSVWKRVFIHRRGYLITQSMNDKMEDSELSIDTVSKQFLIGKNDSLTAILNYITPDNKSLLLSGLLKGDSIKVLLKKIDMSKFPALQPEFHWTIDSY